MGELGCGAAYLGQCDSVQGFGVKIHWLTKRQKRTDKRRTELVVDAVLERKADQMALQAAAIERERDLARQRAKLRRYWKGKDGTPT